MNIFIDPSVISEVLLQDGWHVVVRGTLHTGKFALVEPNTPPLSTPGFTFQEADGRGIAGPMPSILAVRRTPAVPTTEAKDSPAARPTSAPASPTNEPGSGSWFEP